MAKATHARLTPQPASPDLTNLLPSILARLADEGITSLEDWRRLSPQRRRSIFGITRAMVRQLDALARRTA